MTRPIRDRPFASVDEKSKNEPMAKLMFLGTGANGAVPQWQNADIDNVNIRRAFWENPDVIRSPWRFMSSIALSTSTDNFQKHVIIDCPPDFRLQLEYARITPQSFRPDLKDQGYRTSCIDSIFLTHGHPDHVNGLYTLYLGVGFGTPIYGTNDNIMHCFGTKENPGYFRRGYRLSEEPVIPTVIEPFQTVKRLDGELEITPFQVKHTPRVGGDMFPTMTVGYHILFKPTGASMVYTPDIASYPSYVLNMFNDADIVAFDGTFFYNDELQQKASSLPNAKPKPTSYQLGHVPITDALKTLSPLGFTKGYVTHINNSNDLIHGYYSKRRKDNRAYQELNGYNKKGRKFLIAEDFLVDSLV
jgi:coenzyme PQQ biosynthesis protein B